MRSWSVFRRIRVGVFGELQLNFIIWLRPLISAVSISIVSLVLTIVYSLLLSKDFRHYNKLQRKFRTRHYWIC